MNVYCPNCKTTAVASLEALQGKAYINGIDEDGAFEYSGETDVFWDGQETIKKDGKPSMICCECGHEWLFDKDENAKLNAEAGEE